MIYALILIALALVVCLIATPFLFILWILHKWAKWTQGMVNGDAKSNKDVLDIVKKLLKK